MSSQGLAHNVGTFLFTYPLFMSALWAIGAVIYYVVYERRLERRPRKDVTRGISFLVSAYNEEDTIASTIESIMGLSYPVKELIIVNDGSSDRTADVVRELQASLDFTFLDLQANRGKANALNQAVKVAQHSYVMCVDADTIIDDDAPYYMVEDFRHIQGVGAVTGNPRIRNKHSLLSMIQVIEFASIIGLIKRTQQVNGFVNTVSGVFTLFDRRAINRVGDWDIDMATEDIALSWKLHLAGFRILYEPRAMCRMLVPETMRGLVKQRTRWAQGNQEVLLRDWRKIGRVKNPAFWLLFVEQVVSVVWVLVLAVSTIVTLLRLNLLDYYYYRESFNVLLVSAFVLITANIFLFGLAMLIDNRYDKGNLRYALHLSWYPLFYWVINSLAIILAIPKALRRREGQFATWASPDRGTADA